VYSGLVQQAGWWEWDGYPGWRFCAWVTSNGGHRGGRAIINAADLAKTVVDEGITKEVFKASKAGWSKGRGRGSNTPLRMERNSGKGESGMSILRSIYEGCSCNLHMEGKGVLWDCDSLLSAIRSIPSVMYTPLGPPQRSIEVALYRYIAMLLLDWVENILYSALELFELVEYHIKAVANQPQNAP
jgi:hypothetical protein